MRILILIATLFGITAAQAEWIDNATIVKAIEAYNEKCASTLSFGNVSETEEVYAVQDQETYDVSFDNGGMVTITKIYYSFSESGYYVDDVLCAGSEY